MVGVKNGSSTVLKTIHNGLVTRLRMRVPDADARRRESLFFFLTAATSQAAVLTAAPSPA
jgi:hypothetical protein